MYSFSDVLTRMGTILSTVRESNSRKKTKKTYKFRMKMCISSITDRIFKVSINDTMQWKESLNSNGQQFQQY